MTTRLYFTYAITLLIASFFVLPTSKMVNNFYYILIALPSIYFLTKNSYKLKPVNVLERFFLGLCLYYGVHSFFSEPEVIKDTLYVIVFFYTITRLTDSDFFYKKSFAMLLFWGVIAYAYAGAFTYYIIGDVSFGTPVNPGLSRLDNPIHTSMLIACTLFVITPHWLKNRSFFEATTGALLAFLAIALIFQSRSGLVGMAVWLVMISFVVSKKYSIKGLLSLFLAVLITFIVSIPAFDIADQTTQLIDRADSNRFSIWAGYLKAIGDCNLLFGCGFPEAASQHLVIQSGTEVIMKPHNLYIEMVYHHGVVALVIFTILMTITLYKSFQQKNWWGGYLLAGLTVLMFDSNRIMNSPNEIWLLIWLPFMILLTRLEEPTYKTFSREV